MEGNILIPYFLELIISWTLSSLPSVFSLVEKLTSLAVISMSCSDLFISDSNLII